MSKKLVVLGWMTALCCTVCVAQENPRGPRTLLVSVPITGSPANAGVEDGSGRNPFSTIQAAVDVASQGDTVRVKKGVYRNSGFGSSENNGPVVLIKRGGDSAGGSLTLLGEPGAVIEYDGSGGILGGQGVAYVAVRNFVIKGPAGDQRVVSFTAQAG